MAKFTKWAFACAAAACMLYAPEADARAMIVTVSYTDAACATASGSADSLQEPGCFELGVGTISIDLRCDGSTMYSLSKCKGDVIATAGSSGCATVPGLAGSFKSSCVNADWFKMVKPAGGSCNADNTIAVADQQLVGFFKGADTCSDFARFSIQASGKLTALSGVATGTYTGVTATSDLACGVPAAPVTYTVGTCFNDTSASGDTEVGALRMILTASANNGASIHFFAFVMFALACFWMM